MTSFFAIKRTALAALMVASLGFGNCGNQASKNNKSNDTGGEQQAIRLPPGFKMELYASVPNARSMCLAPSGTLFVGNRTGDKVYAVTDLNKDGKADKVYTIAKDMDTPNGVAFKDGSLYIATINSIYRLDNIEAHLTDPPAPVLVTDQYPADGHHGWKFIAFGPDGRLYVPVGAPCNVCEQANPVYASITSIKPDGTDMKVYAHGVRNTVGFAWHPQTKELWFTENGRDNMGNDMPADELNKAAKEGMHFGFPYCQQGDTPDPKFGKGKNCVDFTAPEQKLGPHAAALGMRFYTGGMFPAEYQNQIFIAEHGSWNRDNKIGYRVMLVKLDNNGKAVSYTPFADGWLENEKASGRPVDVQVMPDGALLISDDQKGAVYRVSYLK